MILTVLSLPFSVEKINKKIIIGIVGVVVIAVGVFVLLNLRTETTRMTEQKITDVRPFIFVIGSWEPHAYLDEDGVAAGIVVDVADLAFSRLNVSYEVNRYWTIVSDENTQHLHKNHLP